MSTMYGLRIGDVGIEFTNISDRDKAITIFTRGSIIKISDSEGKRYSPDRGSFSVYDREAARQEMNCNNCHGTFGIETCSDRAVPAMDWSGRVKEGNETEQRCICDGCLVKALRTKEIMAAKSILVNAPE